MKKTLKKPVSSTKGMDPKVKLYTDEILSSNKNWPSCCN